MANKLLRTSAGLARFSSSAASLTRRSMLQGAGIAGLVSFWPQRGEAATGVPFGAAIQSDYFDADPEYRAAFLDRCDLVVPMNELKFGLVHPDRDRFDFERADQLVDWALANGKRSRGHTFVWWNTNPPWLDAVEDEAEMERVLVGHIERVADHYRGRLSSWDVVNEVIANDPLEDGASLRDTVWLRRLGPRHIPLAFQTAARADPQARLVINEYDLEFEGPRHDARRAIMLEIVRQLQDANIRIDAVGLQGHLYAHQKVDIDALARFGEELKRRGVGLIATELDVIDFQVPGGPEAQDAAAGRVVSDFLDGLLAAGRPEAVIAWGITDRYSWVGEAMPRPDGTPSRPLPLNREMRPKPWYEMLRRRLAAA